MSSTVVARPRPPPPRLPPPRPPVRVSDEKAAAAAFSVRRVEEEQPQWRPAPPPPSAEEEESQWHLVQEEAEADSPPPPVPPKVVPKRKGRSPPPRPLPKSLTMDGAAAPSIIVNPLDVPYVPAAVKRSKVDFIRDHQPMSTFRYQKWLHDIEAEHLAMPGPPLLCYRCDFHSATFPLYLKMEEIFADLTASHDIPSHVEKIYKFHKNDIMGDYAEQAKLNKDPPGSTDPFRWTRFEIHKCLRGRNDNAALKMAIELYDTEMLMQNLMEAHMKTTDSASAGGAMLLFKGWNQWRSLQNNAMKTRKEMGLAGGTGAKASGGAPGGL